MELARDPAMDVITYTAKKSDVLQEVLAASDLSDEEKALIFALNTSNPAPVTPEQHLPG